MSSDLGGSQPLCLEPLVLAGGLQEAAAASSRRSRRVCVGRRLLHEAAQRPPRPGIFINRSENGETSGVSITGEVNAEITVFLSLPTVSSTATFNPRGAGFLTFLYSDFSALVKKIKSYQV